MEEIEKPANLTAPAEAKWSRAVRWCRPTFRYWMQTEVHVYAFSIAANVLLSFFPFLIVTLAVCRKLLGRGAAETAVNLVLQAYFPGEINRYHAGPLGFITVNLPNFVSVRGVPVFSLLLLLFTANGIFEPLEVALNKAWGIPKNRSFVRNQVVSLGLIFACGALALASTILTGYNAEALGATPVGRAVIRALVEAAAFPVTMSILFLVYWLLPNARIAWRDVLPAAVVVGALLELLKWFNLIAWPLWHDKLYREYGPFYYSATIIIWSFLGAMLILAGAEWTARRAGEAREC